MRSRGPSSLADSAGTGVDPGFLCSVATAARESLGRTAAPHRPSLPGAPCDPSREPPHPSGCSQSRWRLQERQAACSSELPRARQQQQQQQTPLFAAAQRHAAAHGGGAAAAAAAAAAVSLPRYAPAAGLRCVLLKVWGREPEDLPGDFAERLRALVSDCGCFLTSICVRKGCIELTLDIENADPGPDGDDDREAAAGEADRLEAGTDSSLGPAVRDSAPRGRPQQLLPQWQQQQPCDGCRGDPESRPDLSTPDGALALAQRVHASIAAGAGTGGGEAAEVDCPSSQAAATAASPPKPRPGVPPALPTAAADAATMPRERGGGAVAAAPAPAAAAAAAAAAVDGGGDPAPPPPPPTASVARAVAVGQSSFAAPATGPAVTLVHPRVVGVVRVGRRLVVTVPPQAAAASPGGPVGSGGGGASGGAVGAAVGGHADAAAGGPSAEAPRRGAAAVMAAAAAAQRGYGLIRPIALYVELSAPPDAPLSVLLTPPQPLATSAADAAAAGAAAPAALVPPSDPPVELLVRCSGRYLAAQIQMVAPADVAAEDDGLDDASLPDVAVDGGCGVDGGGGGATAAAAVTRSYIVTLLESPPSGAGVMLVDLRWRGRPAQVVPVVLLDELDEQLRAELSGVAAMWTGPPHELDGLLYDFGAWMRCMAVQRAAGAAARAAAAAVAVGRAAAGRTAPLPERAMAAAAAATASAVVVGGGAGRGERPYLPVLGASLLQFAHAQGLLAVAARLRMDLQVCGYTAPFRPLLGGRMPPSAPAQPQPLSLALQLRPTGHMATASAAAAVRPDAAPDAFAQAAACTPPTGGPAAPPRRLSETAHEVPPRVSSRCDAAEVAAAEGAQGGVRPSAAPAAFGHNGARTEKPSLPLPLPPPPSAAASSLGWRDVSGRALGWTRRPYGRRHATATAMATAGEGSYGAFVEMHFAALSHLFHLLDLFVFLELLLILILHLLPALSSGREEVAMPPTPPTPPLLLPLLLLLLASLPPAGVAVARLLLPAPAWGRVAPAARLARHVCLAAGRLACLALSGSVSTWAGLPSVTCRLYQVCSLGPGALLVEGVVLPAACLLSPPAALLLAAVKLPLYVASSRTAAAAAAAAGHCGGAQGSGGAPSAESAFRSLAITAAAVVTTLACHVYLRLRFRMRLQQQQQQQEEEEEEEGGARKGASVPVGGKAAEGAAAGA